MDDGNFAEGDTEACMFFCFSFVSQKWLINTKAELSLYRTLKLLMILNKKVTLLLLYENIVQTENKDMNHRSPIFKCLTLQQK